MGLDIVEMVMEMERRFGVEITDPEAENSTTPAKLIDVIHRKLRFAEQRVCVSQRAFYHLRRVLVQDFGIARRSVTPDADIRLLTGDFDSPHFWSVLQGAVRAKQWPELVRPNYFNLTAAALVIGCIWIALLAGQAVLAAAFAVILTFSAVYWGPERRCIPGRYARIRELVPFAGTSDMIFQSDARAPSAWTREKVAALVKEIVIEETGLKEEEYWEEGEFVADFGMD